VYTYTYTLIAYSSFCIFIFITCAHRQQIEDLEGKVKILKEQVKKKEENEAKYQGKRNTMILDNHYSSARLYHRVIGSAKYDR
jgi:hypothetical protein